MRKFLKKITKPEIFLFCLLILVAGWVRFQGLSTLPFFTYDQARDALYIKRILDGKLRLIGTQSSIPGLYTAPFYYYLMAPFLLIFSLNPIGIDLGIAFFGLLTVGLFYWLLKKETGRIFLPFIFSFLFAFSPQVVEQSRFGWNPNLLPFFTLLFIWSLREVFLKEKEKFLVLTAFSLGMAINCHYSALALLFAFLVLIFLFRPRFGDKKNLTFSCFLFLFFLSPLLLFDLRHGFINIRNTWRYLKVGAPGKIPPPPFFFGWREKISSLLGMVFNLSQGLKIVLVFLSFLGGALLLFKKSKRKTFAGLVWVVFLSGTFFASLYRGSLFFVLPDFSLSCRFFIRRRFIGQS